MPERVHRIAKAMGLTISDDASSEVLGRTVAKALYEMMKKMNVASLKALGYPRDEIIALWEPVAANHLASYCPVEVTEQLAKSLLEKVYDNYQ
jgi:alcohol dehydrogenase class IV